MNETQFLFFISTSLLIIFIPGQDMVLVMSRGMTQGAKAGVATAAGVSVGLLGHTILASLGLGAILSSSSTLFFLLKYIGAAYLAYLGVRLWLRSATDLVIDATDQITLKKSFFIGALSNISNPKITIFYFAFLPQFVSPDTLNPANALLILGGIFAALTFLLKAPIGYFAGLSSTWIQTRPAVVRGINRVSGVVLLGLGVKLALEHR